MIGSVMIVRGKREFLTRSYVSIALLAMLSAACDDQKRSSRIETGMEVQVGDTSFAPHEHDTIDAPRGVWTFGDVIRTLRSNGLQPLTVDGPVQQRFMGPVGTRLSIPGAEVQVYIYADALARARDTDLVDSMKVAPRTMHADWRMKPSIVVINNAALIVLTDDETLRRRIHAAVRLHPL
jgi:hypothetical protein